MKSWSPTITGSCVTQDALERTMAEFQRQSMSDYRSLRSIPPFTVKSWMNHEFPTNYIVDGANQVTEVVPKLTPQGDMERIPPDPEYGGLPEPVRPPSGLAWCPLPPPHQVTELQNVDLPMMVKGYRTSRQTPVTSTPTSIRSPPSTGIMERWQLLSQMTLTERRGGSTMAGSFMI